MGTLRGTLSLEGVSYKLPLNYLITLLSVMIPHFDGTLSILYINRCYATYFTYKPHFVPAKNRSTD